MGTLPSARLQRNQRQQWKIVERGERKNERRDITPTFLLAHPRHPLGEIGIEKMPTLSFGKGRNVLEQGGPLDKLPRLLLLLPKTRHFLPPAFDQALLAHISKANSTPREKAFLAQATALDGGPLLESCRCRPPGAKWLGGQRRQTAAKLNAASRALAARAASLWR